MKPDAMKQAEALYMKTDLSKSEIAEMTGVSRRTVHHWTASHNWDRLKKSAQHMPALCVENLWVILTRLQESILSPNRPFNPPTPEEIRMINQVGINIRRLTKRSPLNETIELRNHFMDFVSAENPDMALPVQDLIDGFIKARAKIQPGDFMAAKVDEWGCIPHKPENITEEQLDIRDRIEWADNPFVPEEEDANTEDTPETPEETQPSTAPSTLCHEPIMETMDPIWVKPAKDGTDERQTRLAAQQQELEQYVATLQPGEDEIIESALQALLSGSGEAAHYTADASATYITQSGVRAHQHT